MSSFYFTQTRSKKAPRPSNRPRVSLPPAAPGRGPAPPKTAAPGSRRSPRCRCHPPPSTRRSPRIEETAVVALRVLVVLGNHEENLSFAFFLGGESLDLLFGWYPVVDRELGGDSCPHCSPIYPPKWVNRCMDCGNGATFGWDKGMNLLERKKLGCGSKLNRRGYAGFGPCFDLPEFHFGTSFLQPSAKRSRCHRTWTDSRSRPVTSHMAQGPGITRARGSQLQEKPPTQRNLSFPPIGGLDW